jgi:hypothetical protein
MDTLLMAIGGFSIGGYSIGGYSIGGYSIGGYSIGGYSIGGYFSNGYWWCEELLHTFTTKICTHNKNPVGSGTTM